MSGGVKRQGRELLGTWTEKRVKKVGGARLGRPALMWTNRRAPLGEGVTRT